jgi:hypothetical protein
MDIHHLMLVMNLLKDSSHYDSEFEAFHVFKVFVAFNRASLRTSC